MKRTTIALGVLMALLVTGSAFAQGSKGTIQVVAEAADGSRLPGATVTAEAEDVLGTRTSITDASGVTTLAGLAPSSSYVVTTTLDGFRGARNENVLVRAGQTTTLRVSLQLSSVEEELIVTAESPIVDVTSAVTGQDITLELTEALPTSRSYQSYLQLVPGVMPTDPTLDDENPAARSGLNYRDIGGDLGVSRDNYYYLEGINVTDPVQGTFGANLNTEIIQEQSVITGGIPAEFVGSPGLISNVITKSGGNSYSGSLNYYFQNDSLVEDNDNATNAAFSTYDTAFTIGGPVMQDKLWFFGSFRLTNKEDDVIALDTNEYLRTVAKDSEQGFFKLSWAPSQKDSLTGIVLSDPTEQTGETNRDVLNNRDNTTDTGGTRFTLDYSHVFNTAYISAAIGEHNGENSESAVDLSASNDVIFLQQDNPTAAQAQLGGWGLDAIDERDNKFYRAEAELFFDSGWGDHSIKAGYDFQENTSFRDSNTTGEPPALFTSLDARYLGQGLTANDVAGVTGQSWTDLQFDVTNASDFGGLINAINASPNRNALYAALDTNRDGTITAAEAGAAIVFNSTAGNPNNMVNYDRTIQTATGPQELGSEGTSIYVQDTFQTKRFTINAGFRAERYEHFATTGQNIFTFDWEYAPRLSVAFDLRGDGRQKISLYYGRYYDPIRNNMTQFAGTLTGRIREEQLFVNGEWLTYRTRGGPVQQDAFFAPTTKTPYTDDFTIGYSVDLGRSMSFEANVIKRETRDILEDYDLSLYALATDGTTLYPGPIDHPDSLWLGLDYFGYDVNPGSNFVIATLAGGTRDWEGIELVFRKRYSNNWQALASYTLADGSGNTNSDSNADFQGDVIWLDPRAPNQEGTQPGLIEQLFKVAASYRWDNGFQVGGQYRWNSGTIANTTFSASRRNLPIRVTAENAFEFAGITTRWLRPDAVGQFDNPSWGTLDLRGQYNRRLGKVDAELFLDIFNILDEQKAIRLQDLEAGANDGSSSFGDGIQFIPPRRYFLGVRFTF